MKKTVQRISLFIVCINAFVVSYAEKIIRIPLHATYVTLEPYKLQDIASLFVSRQINCQLVRMHGRVPVLEAASSLKYISPLVLNIELKKDVLFSDGTPVTAEDVVATFDYLRRKGTEFRNIYDWIKSIKAHGKLEIIIELKKQTPDFITALSAPHYAIFKKEFLEQADKNTTLWKKPMGCGGYKVYKNNKNNVVLIPNAKGLPITFTFEPKNKISLENTNKYDLIGIQMLDGKTKINGFHPIQTFDPVQLYFAFNTRLPLWKNKKNRCAVFSKINSNLVMKHYGDDSKAADNLLPSGILGYFSDEDHLLSLKKKYSRMDIPNKKDFCVSMLATSIGKEHQQDYLYMLKKIYPNSKIKLITNCSNMNQVIERQKCDGSIFGAKSNYLDAYEYLQELSTLKGVNPTGYYNSVLVNAINNSQMLITAEQKSLTYRKIIKQIEDLCLMYPLFTIPYDTIFVSDNILTPGLGKEPINEYYLGNVSYRNKLKNKMADDSE